MNIISRNTIIIILLCSTSKREFERPHEDGLARAGLARDGVETRFELQAGRFGDGDVFDLETF